MRLYSVCECDPVYRVRTIALQLQAYEATFTWSCGLQQLQLLPGPSLLARCLDAFCRIVKLIRCVLTTFLLKVTSNSGMYKSVTASFINTMFTRAYRYCVLVSHVCGWCLYVTVVMWTILLLLLCCGHLQWHKWCLHVRTRIRIHVRNTGMQYMLQMHMHIGIAYLYRIHVCNTGTQYRYACALAACIAYRYCVHVCAYVYARVNITYVTEGDHSKAKATV